MNKKDKVNFDFSLDNLAYIANKGNRPLYIWAHMQQINGNKKINNWKKKSN